LTFIAPTLKFFNKIDGSQHYLEPGKSNDIARDRHLPDFGLNVLRFSAGKVFENSEGVMQRINEKLP
jgi:very-short-patch-repair endonuclease